MKPSERIKKIMVKMAEENKEQIKV